MKKEDILVVDGTADSWEQAIHLAGGTLYENGFVKEGFEQACIDREKTYPTGLLMDTSIAIPHTDDQFVIKAGVCILRLKEPVDFYRMDAPDDIVSTLSLIHIFSNLDVIPVKISFCHLTAAGSQVCRNRYLLLHCFPPVVFFFFDNIILANNNLNVNI